MIKELHLFAGIGGGIYGGRLLGHEVSGAVEINEFCQNVLKQRQKDGWLNEFPIYGDLTKLNGADFKGTFDILCGGFPCQAFSHAAHGKNIAEKNLWKYMFQFVKDSDAPVVLGENVVLRALETAGSDLENIGYHVEICKLSCGELGADHRRDRYWLLAVKDKNAFDKVYEHLQTLPKLTGDCWTRAPYEEVVGSCPVSNRREQLKAVGNAQSPLVAASVFRILAERTNYFLTENLAGRPTTKPGVFAGGEEIGGVFETRLSWISAKYGTSFGFVHTPTTMANYSSPSMMKHKGCRNFKEVFEKPTPHNAEYLMGFPIGASSPVPMTMDNFKIWLNEK